MGIGLRLKTILRERNKTIRQLSDESGISLNTLYSITKRDSENIDPVILQKLADALEIDKDVLRGYEVVAYSEVLVKNSDGEIYLFSSGTTLGKVGNIVTGLSDAGIATWLKMGDNLLDVPEFRRSKQKDGRQE